MRQSASMAEIATEDGMKEEEEQPATEESKQTEGKEKGDSATTESEGQTSSQPEASAETSTPQANMESDSDTEDEEEEEVVPKSSSSNQTASQPQSSVAQSVLSTSQNSSSPSTSPVAAPSVISGVTVTESPVCPGTPPSPGRCISVSSPGRGHKIFMVTRVESPPEQQQPLKPQLSSSAAPSMAKERSEKHGNADAATTQQMPPSSQTQLTQEDMKEKSPAPTDCKPREQSPLEHLQDTPSTTQSHTLKPQSADQLTEDVVASTLDPKETDPSQQTPTLQTPTLTSESSPLQLTEEATDSTESLQPESAYAEGMKEGEEGCREDSGQDIIGGESKIDEESPTQTSISAEETEQQPSTSADEQLKGEVETLSQESQMDQEESAPEGLENEKPSQEEAYPKQQIEAEKQEVKAVASVKTDEESNPPAGDDSNSPQPGSNSPDESSANEAKCPAEAPEEDAVGSALPNGLKPEFSLHLLDTESPKPGSCVMEHGEWLSSLIKAVLLKVLLSNLFCVICVVSVNCGQDLEELLLEASLETGRDAP